MTEPILSVERLGVRANRRSIVDQVSLTARAGEVTAVIGPNGAGKTTLLEAIVGLRPAEGIVRAGGQRLRSFGDHARTFAYLPDQALPAGEATARTLVAHALKHRRGTVDEVTLGRLLGIEPLLELGAGVLSRGERQRLGLFSALVLGRPVVVLDEPFSVFDPWKLREVLEAVRSVAASGTAVLASIHQLADAEKIADRILLMAEGRAVAFGNFAELKSQAGRADMSLEEVFVTLLSRGSRGA